MGCAGDPVIRTPNLDRLASGGMRLANAYCAAPVCVPSRMTFMTSKECAEIDVWVNGDMLDSREPTFAHTLNEQGYQTVLCARMHFRGPDQQHGFEQRIFGDMYDATWAEVGYEPHILGPTGGMFRTGTFGSLHEQLKRRRPDFCRKGKKEGQRASAVHPAPGKTAVQAYDEHVLERALKFLNEAEHDPERPLAMVVGLFLPHSPYICSRHLFDYYRECVQLPKVDEQWLASLHPGARRKWERFAEVTPEQHREARAAYYGLTEVMDGMVGQIVNALEKSSLGDNTVVVYISDHAEMAGEHGMWAKHNFLDASIAVPMIWSWPSHLPEGAVSNDIVSLIDVGTTLADWAGQPEPFGSGRSLLPLLREEDSADWPDEAFADDTKNQMIRRGRFKLNYYHGYDEIQLFDLEADPEENRDLRLDPAYQAVGEELLAKVRKTRHPERYAKASESYVERNEEKFRLAEAYRTPNDLTWVLDQNDNHVG